MNAHSKPGRATTMTSREFNQHTSRAKAAADKGPVVITDRGEPAYVLMTHTEYERLTSKPVSLVSLAEALADPNYSPDEPDLMDFIPPRRAERIRFRFTPDDDK
jgi:prevent-host-death family protein